MSESYRTRCIDIEAGNQLVQKLAAELGVVASGQKLRDSITGKSTLLPMWELNLPVYNARMSIFYRTGEKVDFLDACVLRNGVDISVVDRTLRSYGFEKIRGRETSSAQ